MPFAIHFDRGTIVLSSASASSASASSASPSSASASSAWPDLGEMHLPGLMWDPRVARFRAPAHYYSAICEGLKQRGVFFRDEVKEGVQEGGLDKVERLHFRSLQLRPYQDHALDAWDLSHRRGLVVLPTGSGKTHVALAAMARVGRPTLVLVPTRVLLGQWVRRIEERYAGSIGVWGDGSRTLKPVTVATFESAFRHMDEFGHRFALLVVDEAHHFGSGLRAEALEMCTAAWRMGLTATPPENPEEAARLEKLLGPVVCYYTIANLAGQHLAPFDRIRLYVELTPEEREAYQRWRAPFMEAYRQFCSRGRRTWSEFASAASCSAAGRQALRGFQESRRVVNGARAKFKSVEGIIGRHAEDRSLIFTADNDTAYALSRLLLIPAITCDIGRKEREQILEALQAGRVRAVVSSRVLNEGIDLPDARVGVITGGVQGEREHVQRVGRLLRPQAGKRAVVYEVVAQDTYEVQHSQRRQRRLVA